MKMFMLSIALFTAGSTCVAMDKKYKLPSEEIISDRLCKAYFEHFCTKTDIVKLLANKELSALAVAVKVEQSLGYYETYLKHSPMSKLMWMSKPDIIKILLQDHPKAIAELKTRGVLGDES